MHVYIKIDIIGGLNKIVFMANNRPYFGAKFRVNSFAAAAHVAKSAGHYTMTGT